MFKVVKVQAQEPHYKWQYDIYRKGYREKETAFLCDDLDDPLSRNSLPAFPAPFFFPTRRVACSLDGESTKLR